ncbi:2'-5'-oligoadenylate synthase 1-like [Halichondria panicea]|uniref:2'-5'-oligoadenylate synthase 1-like n=1 Tax=Halichondria panicea TaxID=6063 RepID=UPI00312B448A
MDFRNCHPPHSNELLTHKAAREATDELATLLKDQQPITISEVIRAGSLGQGTAVPGDFDLDMVIYSRDLDPHKVLEQGYGHWLEKLEKFLKKNSDVQFKNRTPHSVQFRYKDLIDVDMLVTPWWDSVSQLSLFLDKIPVQKRYSFSIGASKWQVQFMQKQDNEVKVLIQRAKAWRNKQWPNVYPGQKKPKSYFLSLLVLKAYQRAKEKFGNLIFRDMAERTSYELKDLVLREDKQDIHWDDYYIVGATDNIILHDTPKTPRLLDPANPTNNLFDTGFTTTRTGDRSHDDGEGNWSEIKRKIETIDLTVDI